MQDRTNMFGEGLADDSLFQGKIGLAYHKTRGEYRAKEHYEAKRVQGKGASTLRGLNAKNCITKKIGKNRFTYLSLYGYSFNGVNNNKSSISNA